MANEAKPRNLWTEEQTLAALHVYLQLPFGKLHTGTPKIKELAVWIGRTPSAVARKLSNLAGRDPFILASGRVGSSNGSAVDDKIWAYLNTDWDLTVTQAAEVYGRFTKGYGIEPDADVLEKGQTLEKGLLPFGGRVADSAADADSFMTSPSWPVRITLPLPGISAASIVSRSPPTSVQARPTTWPT